MLTSIRYSPLGSGSLDTPRRGMEKANLQTRFLQENKANLIRIPSLSLAVCTFLAMIDFLILASMNRSLSLAAL